MADLIERIRQEIDASGKTRYRISQDTGIHQSQLSRLMSGESGITVETLEKLARYLGFELVLRSRRRRSREGG